MSHIPINLSILNGKWLSFPKQLTFNVINFQFCRHSSNDVTKETVIDPINFENEEEDIFEKEAAIERSRNKSRLAPHHRNILFNQVPYTQPMASYHNTVKYNRKLFGKYGQISGVNPGIAWPTKEDLRDKKEYESVAYPFTIQEMVQKAQDRINQENLEIEQRQEKLSQQLLKVEQWKADIEARAAKKLAVATAAKEKKEKLIEEVRRHFGYKVDPRDERFKELLAQKEKTEKKKAKDAKSKAKQQLFLAKLLEKTNDETEKS